MSPYAPSAGGQRQRITKTRIVRFFDPESKQLIAVMIVDIYGRAKFVQGSLDINEEFIAVVFQILYPNVRAQRVRNNA